MPYLKKYGKQEMIKIRNLHKLKQDLIISIIKGMKKILGLAPTELPMETRPNPLFADPLIDIEYIVP